MVGVDADLAQERVPGVPGMTAKRSRSGSMTRARSVGLVGEEAADGSWRLATGSRRLRIGRIFEWPIGLDVVGVDDVVEDVGLGEAEMFEEMPRGVVDVRRSEVDRVVRKVGNGVLEGHVGTDPVE